MSDDPKLTYADILDVEKLRITSETLNILGEMAMGVSQISIPIAFAVVHNEVDALLKELDARQLIDSAFTTDPEVGD